MVLLELIVIILLALASHSKVSGTDDAGGGPVRPTTCFGDASSPALVGSWSWISWFLSVLVCSVVLSSVKDLFRADGPKSGMLTRGLFHKQAEHNADYFLSP